ncbi:MAG: isoprenylcysteine carboxylmethyltransferase family protein, partial [Chitinivibrionales bacterium]|nr:isoprenylcysteine carboxylmethyltransferase family protein [Chitinivibrionales bacterium]
KDQQQLVTGGIYAYLRHPLHYFLLLEMVAMAIIAGYGWGWIVIAVAIIVLCFREIQEEQYLESVYGDQYREYRHHAVAFVDGISKIKKLFSRK